MLPRFLLVVAALFTSTTALPPPPGPLALTLAPNTSPEIPEALSEASSKVRLINYPHSKPLELPTRVLDVPRAMNLPSDSGHPDASHTLELCILRSRDRPGRAGNVQFPPSIMPPSDAYEAQKSSGLSFGVPASDVMRLASQSSIFPRSRDR
ncbi:hypothetical protein R3P38DRAFT_3200912 [Favolaschia claudopus]|uniref:Uncharacterized protein n=1 Tax=Favolaschia claudopus TaxID=2862362 RepID=A0AAW0AZ20_9AGAR